MENKKQAASGQALVESVVALSALLVGLVGVMVLLSQSLGLSRSVADAQVAVYLAAEGVEVVKNIIDSNQIRGLPWDAGLADGAYEAQFDSTSLMSDEGRWLRYDPATNLYTYTSGNPTTFRRRLTLAHISSDELRVVSRVSWTSRGGGSFETAVEDHFFNWRR